MRVSFFIYFFILQLTVGLVSSCYPGIRSIGTVSPHGDIVQEVGSPIIINCTLFENYTGSANSSFIRWRKHETDVDRSYITILDIRTAQLRIDNSSLEDSGFYSCYVDVETKTTVCNNDVKIGYPPQSDVNISCLSLNWDNLTCTWSTLYNPVMTKWSFYFRTAKTQSECHQYLPKRTGCFFSSITIPPYRQAAILYYFVLTGKNELGESKTDYKFSHFEEVLPNPPAELTAIEVASHQLFIRWRPPYFMALFPPMLYYKLRYTSKWNSTWTEVDVGLNITSYKLSGLIPNTNYSIEVYCRSGASDRSPWSSPAWTFKATPIDVPSGKVNITSSSFKQKNAISNRELTLYWEALPRIHWNGNNVTYVIDALEDGLQRSLDVVNLGQTSAVVTNLELEKSYDFRIRAKNEKGLSASVAKITVGPASSVLPVPDHCSVIAFNNGVYQISWTPSGPTNNFTVFWCDAQNDRIGLHCSNSSLKWITLTEETAVNLTLSNSLSYQFAVAANRGHLSSGVVWARCIVPYNGLIGKMKSVSVIRVTSVDITVTWRLECSEQTGILVGFTIYYCPFLNESLTCVNNETSYVFLQDHLATQMTLNNLQPHTMYKLMISATTQAGEGEPSNPMYNSTEEGAPDDTCILGLSSISNTSLVVAVELPRVPNGIVRELKFYVADQLWQQEQVSESREYTITRLVSYTNYSIQVVACTKPNRCSGRSPPLNVTTDIGVPGPPNLINVKLMNTTHVRIDWEEPEFPNGPILGWVASFSWWDENNHRLMVTEVPFREDGSRVRFLALPVACAEENELPGPEYNVTVRAQTDMTDGIPSKTTFQPCRIRTAEGAL